jgi:hypothetical protein
MYFDDNVCGAKCAIRAGFQIVILSEAKDPDDARGGSDTARYSAESRGKWENAFKRHRQNELTWGPSLRSG